MKTDTQNFLEALLWAYPTDDEGNNPLDGYTVFDFSDPFIEAVTDFIDGFRAYLDKRDVEIPEGDRSFGGNVYFSLSGHGVGFWDCKDTEHLQAHLVAYSGDKYRFECVDLSELEDGKLDLSFLPEFIEGYRNEMFYENLTK